MEVKKLSPITEGEALSKVEVDEESYIGQMLSMRQSVALSPKKAKELLKALQEALPEAPQEFLVKVVDVLPVDVKTVQMVAVNYYEISEEDAAKVVELVKAHTKKA